LRIDTFGSKAKPDISMLEGTLERPSYGIFHRRGMQFARIPELNRSKEAGGKPRRAPRREPISDSSPVLSHFTAL
jgi:hypothetical protein